MPAVLIASLGKARTFPRQTVLFQEGEKAAAFYLVRKGTVRVYKMDPQGRELEVARLGPGEFLGEAVAFIGGAYPFFAQSVGEVDALRFEASAVLREVDRNPQAARSFLDLLARKCVLLSARVESLGLQTVRQRLARHLLAGCSGAGRCVVSLKVKKGDLARQLGTVSETLSRTLRQFRDEGLIEVRGPDILIKDCPRLRRETEPEVS